MARPNELTSDQHDPRKLAAESVIVSEKLCAALAIPAGARVLDIGCGTGNAALAAARRHADVVAIDLDETSLQQARARAEAEGLPDIKFEQMDAASMPFADASFDCVVSTHGIVFLPDQEAAAKELARVVRPGGLIGLTAWTRLSVPSMIFDLLVSRFAPGGLPKHPHYLWSDGVRAGELLNPYFQNVQIRYDSYDSCAISPRAQYDFTSQWNPNIQRTLSRLNDEQKKEVARDYLAILDKHNRAADGTYLGNMDYAIISAVRRG